MLTGLLVVHCIVCAFNAAVWPKMLGLNANEKQTNDTVWHSFAIGIRLQIAHYNLTN